MSDANRALASAAVDLLSVIAETPGAEIAGAVLMDHYGAVAPRLLDLGVLIPEGHETTTTSLADHDDVPVTVIWSAEHRAFGYFSATAGWVTVPADRLAMYRIAFDKLLRQLVAPLFASKHITLAPLLPNLLWEVGDVKVPGRSKRVPLWIGRGLGDPKVWSRFSETVHARPAPGLRIVLSLTPADRLPAQVLQGHSIVGVRDIVDHARGLVVDPDLLAARIASGSSSSGALITMAADGASVTVRGRRYAFTGSKQRAVIRQLYEAWQAGSPECLTAKILDDAGNSGSVNTLAKAFSRREDWRDFIREERGRCWMFV
jgi:hypothetical protein